MDAPRSLFPSKRNPLHFYQKKLRGKKKKDKLGATLTDESVASSTLTDDDIVSNPSPVVGRRLDLPPRLWTNDPTPSAAARAFPHLPIQDWPKDHPDYIVPVEDRSNIVVSDFKEVSCEAELLEVMRCASGIRIISSGWSWNRMIQADPDVPGACNVVFTRSMSTHMEVDVANKRAIVSAGLQIADFVWQLEWDCVDLEWPAKGLCFTNTVSQCFGGFIGTNVHHSYTPTAFDWVEALWLAVYIGGEPQIVRASRNERRDLFESAFGICGITGIIVKVELRLRQTTYWDVTTSRLPLTRSRPACGRAAPWDTEQMKGLLLQITQDSDGQPRPTVSPVNGSMVIFETDQGRNFVRVVSPAVPNDEGQAEAGGEGN